MINTKALTSVSNQGKRSFTVHVRVQLFCLLCLVGSAANARPLLEPLRLNVFPLGLSQEGTATLLLEQDKPIEREMAPGQSHSYQLTIATGQYARVVVEQKGIDVMVNLFSPDGKLIVKVDSPNGTQGPEPVSIIAGTTGIYRLEVISLEKNAKTGRYEVRIVEHRPATQQDRDRLTARRAFDEGIESHTQNTRDSLTAAIGKYEEALSLYRATGDRSEQFEILINMSAAYRVMSEPQKALEHLNQALQLAQALGDKSKEGESLRLSIAVYEDSGQLEKALQVSDEALRLYRATDNRDKEAITLYKIGQLYRKSGELEKALRFSDESLQLYRAIGKRDSEAAMLRLVGELYSILGEQEEARERYDQAMRLYQSLGDKNGEASVLHVIGYSYVIQEEFPKALDYFMKSVTLWRITGNKQNEAIGQSFVSSISASLGERQKALDHAARALLLRQEIGKADSGTAIVLTNVGLTYSKWGEFEKALAYYDEALRIWQTSREKRSEAITLKHISSTLRDQGKLREAKVNIEKSIALLEFMRDHAGSPEAQASFVASLFDFYEYYIDLLMRLHEVNPKAEHNLAALAFTEKVKVRSLVELLARARVDLREGVDGTLLERERVLNERITARLDNLTKLLRGQYTSEQRSATEREIDALKEEYQRLQAEIRLRSPRYAALTKPQPLTIEEIQQQVLDGDTILLEYALGKEHSYLWMVTPERVESYQLPAKKEIEAQARRVYQLLTARQPAQGLTDAGQRTREAQADAQYQQQALILSRMLLGPVYERLGTKRLLVVADGALAYLPFAVLPAPMTGMMAIDKGAEKRGDFRYLVLDHEIVSLPSASMLAVLRRGLADRPPASKGIAVLADPVFELDDTRVKLSLASKGSPGTAQKNQGVRSITQSSAPSSAFNRALRSVRGETAPVGLRRLLFSRDEAEAILSVVPQVSGLKALDFRANRKLALSDVLSKYRIIHFSTHGLLDSRHPELSGLVLSLIDEQGQPIDGFLRLHEIYNMRLSADMVVLSACQTGLGREVKGEGLIGITRGFMYAGTSRVMASLWQVDDAATATLMKRFYRGVLQEKLSPAAALRVAQVEMLRKKHWQSPYYWGAFVLQGEWR